MQTRTRGPRRFFYTYDAIALATGWTRDQVMRTARAKSFDPADLQSVVDLVRRVDAGQAKPTSPRYGARRT